jgi:hypothetical protein
VDRQSEARSLVAFRYVTLLVPAGDAFCNYGGVFRHILIFSEVAMSTYFKTLFTALAAAATLTALPATAQNYNLRPSYGSVTLNAGFLPDPRTRTVRAGGDNHFSGGGGCPGGGWFANAPDYRLYYRPGGYALTIYVRAPGDTMLLINDPTTSWFCNDDSNGTLDPMIRFNNPRPGQYDMWVGTYNRSRVRNATIYISER